MQVSQIRQKFLQFFVSNQHQLVKSSSLIPHDDPTLLFTNAGMNQFKDTFLGQEKRDYLRAVSAQKCVRAGGKHNDLENVGYTARHHTFFEMLGNFSFGDYFKLEAIKFAWEFLTDSKWLNLSSDKLYVTVYYTDDEAYNIWQHEIGLAPERIIRIADKPDGGSDNFWQMGETGPCGPCSEIFYDHGEGVFGGLPGTPDENGDRYIEIWNIVFMQYNRDHNGTLNPLPKPSVDTGMGLERIAAVLQNVHSNYEIDLFVALINQAAKITHCADLTNPSLKVIADHIRATSFLIADGALPSNEGRGYVVRRIIRRAIRHGYKLGCRAPFLYKLTAELVKQMGDAYHELVAQQQFIEKTLEQEERRFFQTIGNGMEILNKWIKDIKITAGFDNLAAAITNIGYRVAGVQTPDRKQTIKLPGDIAFKLYDTFGFPLDLTEDVCREHNIQVDIAEFDKLMEQQRNNAKAADKFKINQALEYQGDATNFLGYTDLVCSAQIVALYRDSLPVEQLNSGEEGIIVLNQSVFYAESGGQIGDSGEIVGANGVHGLFVVNDTKKIRSDVFGHIGLLSAGSLKVGDTVNAVVDICQRVATARNHSVTHLLHKALTKILGSNATQKGSLVNHEYTRFDFAHDKPLSSAEIEQIELMVNQAIMDNYPVSIANMDYDQAISSGAVGLFGEKYAEIVRVIKMGDISTELCGGTHVSRTGDIGFFTITTETGIANGVRRIEAVTGNLAIKRMQHNMAVLDQARDQLKAQSNEIINEKIDVILAETKLLNKEITQLKGKLANFQADELVGQALVLDSGAKVLVLRMDNLSSKAMVELIDKFKDKLGSALVVLGGINEQRANLVVGVSKDLLTKYSAREIFTNLTSFIEAKGGGKAELAQGSGSNISGLDNALSHAKKILINHEIVKE